MRITSNMFADSFVSEAQTLQQRQFTNQRDIASGKRIHSSSDDPSAYRKSLEIQSDQKNRIQHRDNINEIISKNEIYLGYSQQTLTIASRASELITRISAGYTQTELDITAKEIDGLLREAVNFGNAQNDGQFLFGGTYLQPGDMDGLASYVPFRTTLAINGDISSVTYRGNYTINQVQVDSNLQVGSNVLGASIGTSPRGLFTAGAVDIFSTLINIRDQLRAGNTAFIPGNLISLQQVEDNIANVIGLTAGELSRLKMAGVTHDDRLLQDETIVSRLIDTDYVKAATDLQHSLTAYEAALQTGARVMNLSLLDYI